MPSRPPWPRGAPTPSAWSTAWPERRGRSGSLAAPPPPPPGGGMAAVSVPGRGRMQPPLDGIRAGGDDYLVKPVDHNLLLATVAGRLERARSVRTLIERDPLTQTLTRAALLRAMTAAVADHDETGMPYSVGMLSIDHFKTTTSR